VTTEYIFILLGTGVGTGFASGLLGLGGGFIMIPVTYWVTAAMGIPQATAIRIAFGTSLLVILPTATSGAWRHNKKKAVRWKAALILGLCGSVGAIGGATLAAHIPGRALEIGFGGLLLALAVWLGLGMTPKLAREGLEPRDNPWPLAACGFSIGVATGLTGMGLGALIIAALVLVLRFPMHTAIGTSLASMIFTSLGGIIGYIVNGIGVLGLPAYSIGYINLPICLCLAATSVPMAQLGARTAHVLPAKQLSYLIICIMVYIGLKMLGVF